MSLPKGTLHWDESGISPVRYNLQDEAETGHSDGVRLERQVLFEQLNSQRERVKASSSGMVTDDEGRQLEPGVTPFPSRL